MTGPVPDSWVVDAGNAGAREVTDGVWRLRLPMAWPGIDHANAWIVPREDGVMLVDTGIGGDPSTLDALRRAFAQAGHALEDVRAMVITHAHSDHLGLVSEVIAASGAELWINPDDDHFHRAVREPEATYERRARRARREGVPEARVHDFATTDEEELGGSGPLVPDHALVPGATLPSSLGDWQVVPAPGHAPSHVMLVQPEHRLAIVGDVVCIVFADAWMDYGWTADPVQEWLDTLDRLDGLQPLDYALPGHGRPLTDLPTVLAEHREGLGALVTTVRDGLAAGTVTGYGLMERLYGPVPDGIEAVGHMTELLSVLRHLRNRGEVTREEDADGVHTYRLNERGPA